MLAKLFDLAILLAPNKSYCKMSHVLQVGICYGSSGIIPLNVSAKDSADFQRRSDCGGACTC